MYKNTDAQPSLTSLLHVLGETALREKGELIITAETVRRDWSWLSVVEATVCVERAQIITSAVSA